MKTTLSEEAVLSAVRAQIERMRSVDSRLPASEITLASSLTTDLGLDSISMVELACGLEETLGLQPLPLHQWLADESEKQDRYSVAALVKLALAGGGGAGARLAVEER